MSRPAPGAGALWARSRAGGQPVRRCSDGWRRSLPRYPPPISPDMGTGAELRRALLEFGTGPLLAEMPRRTLADKGIAAPRRPM